MIYTEIFNEIVSIMKIDSATHPDFGAGDFEKYSAKISDDMDRMEFLHLMQDYLETFGVVAHLGFGDKTCGGAGFSVMKNGDSLYVTQANKGTGLVPGDRITAVDSLPLEEIAQIEKNMLMGETDERQGMLWPPVLKFHKTITVEHEDGSKEDIAIKLGTESEPTEKFSTKLMVMTLCSYASPILLIHRQFQNFMGIVKIYLINVKT